MSTGSLNPNKRLSRHVVQTRRRSDPVLFNTVTRRALSPDAPEEELSASFSLAGQEEQAIESFLFAPRTTLTLTLIVTWECNLRCNHCTVLGKLVPEQVRHIDADSLVGFVQRFREHSPEIEKLKITLLGGEPLLRPELCRELIDATRKLAPTVNFDTTTNLAVELGEEQLSVLAGLDDIIVSLDGLEQLHNAQRKPYRASFNPYERTKKNIVRLVEAGLGEKLFVQGAIRDDFATVENFQDFQRELMALGVRYNRIAFETIHPAEHKKNPQASYLTSLKTPRLRGDACCKFRGGRKLVIDHDNTIRSDYYDWDELGNTGDAIPLLLDRHRELVLRTMPALADPACRRCPVIGYCWGGCTNSRLLTGDRPSHFCNQLGLIETVRKLAADGRLRMPNENGMPDQSCIATG